MQKQEAEDLNMDEEIDFEEAFLQNKKTKKTKRKYALRDLQEINQPNYGNQNQIVYHQEKRLVLRLDKPTFQKPEAKDSSKVSPEKLTEEQREAQSPSKRSSTRTQSRDISRAKSRNTISTLGKSPKSTDVTFTKTLSLGFQ